MKCVVSGDNHVRYDPPICRMENQEEWLQFQKDVLTEIVQFTNDNDAHLFLTGDLNDVPRVGAEIVNMVVGVLSKVKKPSWLISGNHEKLYHRESNVDSSSIGVFKQYQVGNINYLVSDEHVYGNRFEHSATVGDITLVHTLTFIDEDHIPFGIDCCTADSLLDKYPSKYIFTGDMHEPFVYEKDGRFVINPGKMIAQTVKEYDITPCIYMIDTDTNEITKHELPNPPISRKHLDVAIERNARIEEALKSIKDGEKVDLDFKKNLDKAMLDSSIEKGTIQIIDEIEEEISGRQ